MRNGVARIVLRIVVLAGVLLPACADLSAQRALLGKKGRVPERAGTSGRARPVRVLPRRTPAPTEAELAAAVPVFDVKEFEASRRIPTLVQRALADRAALPGDAIYPLPRPWLTDVDLSKVLPSFVRPPDTPAETAIASRWRIGFPAWQRYDKAKLDTPYARSRWWDPFNRNVAKGDTPVFGRKTFLNFSGTSDTLVEMRRLPIASDVSTANPGESSFFGNGRELFVKQDFRLTLDLFHGSAGFKPVDWEVRFTPQFDINYLRSQENGVTNIDVTNGTRRTDSHVGIQELFYEMRLFTNSTSALRHPDPGQPGQYGSAYFDFTSVRMGIQRFTSDFRGFIFSDEQPGARVFGNLRDNRLQYNLAYFNMLEKDTNSGLNTFQRRHQTVSVANLYWQDFVVPGYTVEFSLHYNNDQPTFHLDENGNLVRPAPLGIPVAHKIRAGYLGFAGDGHIGRFNVSNAFYQVLGRDNGNGITDPPPFGKQDLHINAQLAALEVSYDRDWLRYSASVFYTSGAKDINRGRARGFDSIVDNQSFAGGGFLNNGVFADRGFTNPVFEGGGVNLFNRQAIPLSGTGVNLLSFNSLMPTLRTSKDEGQANFLNPGIEIFNAGLEAKITPKLKAQFNTNYLRFNRTEVLETLLFQSGIKHEIGWDYGLGVQYRPRLSDNIVITAGFGVLQPGDGFRQIYTGQLLYSGFVLTRFVF